MMKDNFVCVLGGGVPVLSHLWDLSSQTKVRTVPPAVGAWGPNHWAAREFSKDNA